MKSSLRSEDNMIDNSFRHSAGFGKRMEYKIVGDMLMEGLDCYMPLVDDHGVDCVIKREDGVFIEIQIKARSKDVTDGDAALFSAITHELTPNFYFVFYGSCAAASAFALYQVAILFISPLERDISHNSVFS